MMYFLLGHTIKTILKRTEAIWVLSLRCNSCKIILLVSRAPKLMSATGVASPTHLRLLQTPPSPTLKTYGSTEKKEEGGGGIRHRGSGNFPEQEPDTRFFIWARDPAQISHESQCSSVHRVVQRREESLQVLLYFSKCCFHLQYLFFVSFFEKWKVATV